MSPDRAWLTALMQARGPCVLVTVARAEGSVPRGAGTKMLVSAAELHGTIGGGHLELRACEIARAMLQDAAVVEGAIATPVAHYRFPLGPSLGQCCGGAAELVFEFIPSLRPAWVAQVLALLADGRGADLVTSLEPQQGKTIAAAPAHAGALCELQVNAAGARLMAERIMPCDFRIMLFGAGHVGTALVGILGGLPCEVTWIDGREAQFPPTLPQNVCAETDDAPESLARRAFPGTYFLVMTHDHGLDQAISEAILRRGDFAWFGLIGSATKRRLFERRLAARGIAAETLARMTCPIGIEGIDGKQPGVIAVAVAAQLLATHQCLRQAGLTRHE